MKIAGVTPQKTDALTNGVFVLADDSWEVYVREYAKVSDKDEDWIQNVLANHDFGEPEKSFYPKKDFWVAIIETQMTLSTHDGIVYQVSRENGSYIGCSLVDEVDLWASNRDIYVHQGTTTFHFQRDDSYRLSDTAVKLAKPKDVYVESRKNETNFLFLQWNYCAEYGTMGVGVEIKKAGVTEFQSVRVEQPYMNMFTVQLDATLFAEGDNFVKLYHIGGPTIHNDKTLVLYENSDFMMISVHVADNGVIELE